MGWWAWGYAISSSSGSYRREFAGDTTDVFSPAGPAWVGLFFNWTFAAASSTIVSGAVAGRMKLLAYVILSSIIGWIIFPLFSHWAWASNGWLYKRGFIDFAGSGVVHVGGGVAALIASVFLGARSGRFEFMEKEKRWVDRKPRGHSIMMAYMGTLLLWFGWFGFNAGSSLGMSDGRYIVSVTALFNSSLAASASVLTMTVINALLPVSFNFGDVMNAALAGLVAITAGCATQSAWGAVITGMVSAPLYKASSTLIAMQRIDDPVDAVSVHCTCGIWGVIAVAFFSNQELVDRAYGVEYIPDVGFQTGNQLGIQLYGIIAMIGFVGAVVVIALLVMKYTFPGGIRVHSRDELVGNDYAYFGGYAYPDWEEMVREARAHDRRKAEIKRRQEKRIYDKIRKNNGRVKRRHMKELRREVSKNPDRPATFRTSPTNRSTSALDTKGTVPPPRTPGNDNKGGRINTPVPAGTPAATGTPAAAGTPVSKNRENKNIPSYLERTSSRSTLSRTSTYMDTSNVLDEMKFMESYVLEIYRKMERLEELIKIEKDGEDDAVLNDSDDGSRSPSRKNKSASPSRKNKSASPSRKKNRKGSPGPASPFEKTSSSKPLLKQLNIESSSAVDEGKLLRSSGPVRGFSAKDVHEDDLGLGFVTTSQTHNSETGLANSDISIVKLSQRAASKANLKDSTRNSGRRMSSNQ
eukprot:CAMPEP_0114495118 /NCGR_PEP_ID=MMETSP0109-20121206/5030_1 /TAXON_ID=29199 /ORGANISM="Chlorarachnion reptans, Strain CCCM449" /LENGTH=693 /DNA_ID=CAMNT_0001672231 /DNA_START=360 /DNA_END=2441 /DNA_ORIENTATION=-